MLKKSVLIDLTHNEMLNTNEDEFKEFLNLLKRLDLKIKKNENGQITKDILENIDLLIIGNPIDDFFSSLEIKHVVDHVRSGGGLLLLSEYGSDSLQKTNLNDVSGKFGIFFEKNLIKEMNDNNQNCTSILHIQDFLKHQITKNLREMIIGGACSLFINKEVKPLLQTKDHSVWSEVYNNNSEKWTKDKEEQQIIAAYTEFGQGKVVALGDIDIFTLNSRIGLNSFDNRKFVQNVINWLITPVKESKVMTFILNLLGDLQYGIKETNKVLNNIIETMTILEKRISYLENNSKIFTHPTDSEESFKT
ncbi:MAG: hypothetical protein CEE43_04215 [Promethearchaeota archaeon Loki_b32]|nr:MAG: hypothetical protein CEE43_04215 [Candidatus Lokiarchaeota archaeon Loki_b32]